MQAFKFDTKARDKTPMRRSSRLSGEVVSVPIYVPTLVFAPPAKNLGTPPLMFAAPEVRTGSPELAFPGAPLVPPPEADARAVQEALAQFAACRGKMPPRRRVRKRAPRRSADDGPYYFGVAMDVDGDDDKKAAKPQRKRGRMDVGADNVQDAAVIQRKRGRADDEAAEPSPKRHMPARQAKTEA